MLSVTAGRGVLLASPPAAPPESPARSTNGVTALFAAVRHILRVLPVWQGRSAGHRTLADLDDRLLQDIGLTRADVELEFWRGPIIRVPSHLTPGEWSC